MFGTYILGGWAAWGRAQDSKEGPPELGILGGRNTCTERYESRCEEGQEAECGSGQGDRNPLRFGYGPWAQEEKPGLDGL